MKKGMFLLMIALGSITGIARAQQQPNVINQYGPPNFTGGSVETPSESYARYQEQKVAENPVTTIESAYPDPVQSVSNVVLADVPVRPVSLYVINLNGTIMKSFTYPGGNRRLSFDVSDLQDGVYDVQVREEGKIVQSIKLLKRS